LEKLKIYSLFILTLLLASCGGGGGGGNSTPLSNANLSNIELSSGFLTPDFNPAATSYTVTEASQLSSLQVTPTLADPTGTVTINGVSVLSGQPSSSIPLVVGVNTIGIVVLAPDGVATKTYTLEVTRLVSDTVDLSDLEVSVGTLNPGFDPLQTAYSVTTDFASDSVQVTPTLLDTSASVTVNAFTVSSSQPSPDIPLIVGSNTVDVVVTAANGTSVRNYTLSITRLGDASLSGIALSSGVLDPAFSSVQTSYSANVNYGVSTIRITPTLTDSSAVVTVNGVAVASGQESSDIPLNVGINSITLVVTASGVPSQTYTVQVRRFSDVTLSNLELSIGSLDQAFQPSLTNYSSSVGFLIPAIQIRPTLSDSSASVKINGVSVNSGENSELQHLGEGQNSIPVEVTGSDGLATEAYLVDVTRDLFSNFAQRAYAKASNTDAYDNYGYSVDLSGDTLVVGANRQDEGAPPNSGAVYVLTRDSNGIWSQEAFLKSSTPVTDDYFGYSVAVSGDTLAVGAWGDDSGASGINGNEVDDCGIASPINCTSNSGAVYVFKRTGTTWAQEAYIKADNNETLAGDEFGRAVALSNDTLVVGAPYEDGPDTGVLTSQQGMDNSPGDNMGAVYVFKRSGSVWNQEAYIKASNTLIGHEFGWSVALSGETLAVGAPGEESAATGIEGLQVSDCDAGSLNCAARSGAVYVFTRSGATWIQQAYIKADNTGAGDEFGFSLALSENTLAVSSIYEDSDATGTHASSTGTDNVPTFDSGAVYVFTRSGGNWSQQAYIKGDNTGIADEFGYSLALSGETLVVGSKFEDSDATGITRSSAGTDSGEDYDSGAAYVFTRNGISWSQEAYIKAHNAEGENPVSMELGDNFGNDVALVNDTLVIGGKWEDNSITGIHHPVPPTDDAAQSDSGAVYIFQ